MSASINHLRVQFDGLIIIIFLRLLLLYNIVGNYVATGLEKVSNNISGWWSATNMLRCVSLSCNQMFFTSWQRKENIFKNVTMPFDTCKFRQQQSFYPKFFGVASVNPFSSFKFVQAITSVIFTTIIAFSGLNNCFHVHLGLTWSLCHEYKSILLVSVFAQIISTHSPTFILSLNFSPTYACDCSTHSSQC